MACRRRLEYENIDFVKIENYMYSVRIKDVFLVCVACFVFFVLAFVDFLNMVIEGEQRMISRYGCI